MSFCPLSLSLSFSLSLFLSLSLSLSFSLSVSISLFRTLSLSPCRSPSPSLAPPPPPPPPYGVELLASGAWIDGMPPKKTCSCIVTHTLPQNPIQQPQVLSPTLPGNNLRCFHQPVKHQFCRPTTSGAFTNQ